MSQMNNPFGGYGGNMNNVNPGMQSQPSGRATYDPFSQGPPAGNQQTMTQNQPYTANQTAPPNYSHANSFASQPPAQNLSQSATSQFSASTAPGNLSYQAAPHQPHDQQQFFPPQSSQPQQPAGSNALVVSNQPSNPYALGPASQVPTNQFSPGQSQSLVPAPQQSSSWGQQAHAPSPAVNPFDPFAPTPPPPAPPPAPVPVAAMVPAAPALYASTTNGTLPPQYPPNQYHQQQQMQGPPPPPTPFVIAPTPQPEPPARNQIVPRDVSSQYQNPPRPPSHTNKYSNVLAATAPSNAAPLPSSDKVVKSGFVLSRISFRTILLKKWKQSYWVQYGPHTMLWFRSHTDFDDWLNNPYHTQQQRNFLIKLAVNFVHDLYKPNVRGYQVTQARRKQYRNQILKQFKLERWMDYGPTIAAAFASSDPKEVDELRQAIVECMRNTPVGDGIRATGAVRQDHPNHDPRATQSGQFSNSAATSASANDIRDDHRAFDNQSAYDAQSVPGMASTHNFAQTKRNPQRGNPMYP